SNGSSSMASVCGGALALMDAGVPLKAPVAGVAMGLVMNEQNGKVAVLCGAELALMDAGVPLKAPVAGVAMGLVMNEQNGKWAVLSDIAGAEDHYGDMDFKVAGTKTGITALQMDIKVSGITMDIMRKALEQARQGRMEILDKMSAALAAPREQISSFAPRIVTIRSEERRV